MLLKVAACCQSQACALLRVLWSITTPQHVPACLTETLLACQHWNALGSVVSNWRTSRVSKKGEIVQPAWESLADVPPVQGCCLHLLALCPLSRSSASRMNAGGWQQLGRVRRRCVHHRCTHMCERYVDRPLPWRQILLMLAGCHSRDLFSKVKCLAYGNEDLASTAQINPRVLVPRA